MIAANEYEFYGRMERRNCSHRLSVGRNNRIWGLIGSSSRAEKDAGRRSEWTVV